MALFDLGDARGVARTPSLVIESTTGVQPRSALQSSTATYQPTTSLLPFGRIAFSDKQDLVSNELAGLWTLEPVVESDSGSTLWDTFFSNIHAKVCLEKLRQDKYYGASNLSGDACDGPGMPNTTERWKIPKILPQDGKPIEEVDIVESFVEIFNKVISTLGVAESRVAVDGQRVAIRTRDQGTLKPDVFLWGKGSPAFPPISGRPKETPHPREAKNMPTVKPHQRLLQKHQKFQDPALKHRRTRTQKQPKKAARKGETKPTASTSTLPMTTSPANSAEVRPPDIDWPWCCVPIEVKTASERGTGNEPVAFHQLGTYVREVFAAQSNRRFIPSLVLTEHTVEFLLWDRAGVVVSHPIDYHNRPLEFCSMLASLVMWDDQELGFDPTVFWRGEQLYIKTKEATEVPTADVEMSTIDVEYVVEETLIRSYTLRGQAFTCWRASRPDKKGSHYIIQDSWVEGGMKSERAILHAIEAARIQHNIAGIAPFIHIEDVQIPGVHSYLDTTKRNRRYDKIEGNIHLVHTRTVLLCWRNSRPLETFTTSQELVNTLKDVIQTHGELYEKAGILHRDIVPWNILIQPGAPEGHRGILIGFTNAARTNSVSRRLQITPGSHLFRCCNSLAQRLSNTHLDDLESFYWILCFIIAHHAKPGLATSRLNTPSEMVAWTARDEKATMSAKFGHLWQDFDLQVSTDFSRTVRQFALDFHDFFARRERVKKDGRMKIPSSPGADYQELGQNIARAIQADKMDTSGTSDQRLSSCGKRSLGANAPTSASKRFCIYLGLGLPLPGGDIRLGDIIEPIDVGSDPVSDNDSESDTDDDLDRDSAVVDRFLKWSVKD